MKTFLILIILILSSAINAEQVDTTNLAISKAMPGDYIVRDNGEIVFLKQADIDYANEQIGNENPNLITKRSSNFVGIGIGLFALLGIVKAIFKISKWYGRNNWKEYGSDLNNENNFLGQTGKKKTYIDQKGYRRFIDSNKPLHRYLAEKKIGRKLLPGEVVHHINRNKLDNSADNLEVIKSQEEHDKIHKESGWY